MIRFAHTAIAAALLSFSSGCVSLMAQMAPGVSNVEDNLSADFPFESHFIDVNGSSMHYVEAGEGAPILLVHGNPTSSYLWRNVIPHLQDHGRVIAVDLIGMGQSDKPPLDYRFADHAVYLEGFIEAMGLTDLTLVLHDWGGGLGLDYYARHNDTVRGVVLMEAVVKPMSWDNANMAEKFLFGQLRDPETGHRLAAVDNVFVEDLLPMMAGRPMTAAEMARYYAPFPTVESRKPVAMWPREIPFLGEAPFDNIERIGANYEALRQSEVPVMFLHAEPGMIFKAPFLEELAEEIPRARFESVGTGIHYLQETQPTAIGALVADFVDGLAEPVAQGR
ncbi:MAG: haloalkane dehalogenase [Myxococcota bacterium]